MKEFNRKIPENTYTLSEGEIAVIHALCFYNPDGMTPQAERVRAKLQDQLQMHEAVGKFKVWKD